MTHCVIQCSRKFITTSKRLKSFEVDSSRHADFKSSQVKLSRMCSRLTYDFKMNTK